MDQLKQYWEIAKKQHFWILCGLAVLIPFVASMVASGHLAKIYTDQKSKINGVNGALDPLVNAPDHPNNEWVVHVQAETERLRTNVKDAWDTLYKQQQSALKWPPELKSDFIAAFSKPAAADDSRAMEPLCERYQNFVKTELAHMADIVHAKWAPGEKGAPQGAGGPHMGRPHAGAADPDAPAEETKTYIVAWDPADQSRLVDAYDWQDPPSTLDVRYAQEELWVLEAIFKSIDRTNVGATGDFDAVVREIDRTLIGYDATDRYPLAEGSGRIELAHKSGHGNLPGPPGAPPGLAGPGGPQAASFEPKRPVRHRTTEEGALGGHIHPPGTPFGAPGGTMPAQVAPGGPADPDGWLKDGRYVDDKGKPMLGSDWANSTTPEFNLMAFKLTIVADEQRWQKLLVELCNSPLPLEVREVRINPNDREAGRGGGSMFEHRGGHESGSTGSTLHNVTLEIYGVAYLMNPPNYSKLGITAAGGATATAANVPAANPLVANPAVATPPTAPANAVTSPTTPPAGTPAATPTTVPSGTAAPTTAPTPPVVPTGPPPAATTPATVPAATAPTPTTTTAPPTTTTPSPATPPVIAPATTPATTPPAAAPPATPARK